MYRSVILLLLSFSAFAHEMTPSHPELKLSHVPGVLKAEMAMFNKRQDVQYYEIGVFTEDWRPVPFVSSYRLAKLRYLEHLNFDVYIREEDATRAAYLCSLSKLKETAEYKPAVSSRICSRFR